MACVVRIGHRQQALNASVNVLRPLLGVQRDDPVHVAPVLDTVGEDDVRPVARAARILFLGALAPHNPASQASNCTA